MKRLKILVTNDDGKDSVLFQKTLKILENYGDITVIVPAKQQSGTATALTLFKEIPIEKISENFIIVHGTPADCVSYGLNHLSQKFDLVISGPNNGWNITYDTLHSGTLGACVEASINSVASIALSFDDEKNADLSFIPVALDYIFKNQLIGNDYILNVNFPTSETIKGIVLSKVGKRNDHIYFSETKTGATSLRTLADVENAPKNSDIWLTSHGYISISPLSGSYFSNELFDKVLKMIS